MSAVIADAAHPWARTVADSLGRRGVRLTMVGGRPGDFGFYSRHLSRRLLVPEGLPEQTEVAAYAALSRDGPLLPMDLRTTLLLSKHRGEVAPPLLPPAESLDVALDKARTTRLAETLGVPAPKTMVPANPEESDEAGRRLEFPVVVKLKSEVGTIPGRRYRVVRDRSLLRSAYEQMSALQPAPLVQEWVDGESHGFCAVFDRGSDPVQLFMHRAIHEFPPNGGRAVYAESVYDERLLSAGLKLLRALRWVGPAEIDFVRGKEDGEFRVMEINPRFWFSLPLAVAAGADFPYACYRAAAAEGPLGRTDPLRYRRGVKHRTVLDFVYAPWWLTSPRLNLSRRAYLRSFFEHGVKTDAGAARLHYNMLAGTARRAAGAVRGR